MACDFTIEKYSELCKAIVQSDYRVLTVKEYLQNPIENTQVIIMRHDVDRKPANALKMAQLENDFRISATYYFRSKAISKNIEIVRQVAALGHEIGYHYETLAKAKGDYKKAIKIFEEDLQEFTKISCIKTICMHGSPLSRWDNRDLWKKFDFRRYGIIGEPYLSFDFRKVAYLSDTGRNWNSLKHTLRDKVEGQCIPQLSSTDNLISLIENRELKQICILVHPERWDSKIEWLQQAMVDFLINQMKRIIQVLRKRHL